MIAPSVLKRRLSTFSIQKQGFVPSLPAPEEPEEQRQNRADDQTRDQRKMKTEIPFAVIDIARQPAQPAPAQTRPEESARRSDQQSDDHQHFSDLAHPEY